MTAPGPRRRYRRRHVATFPDQLAKLNAQHQSGMLAPGEYEARLDGLGPHGQRLARRLGGTARAVR